MLKIGKKLRQLRDRHGFTQEDVADKLGMSQSNYSRLESDKYDSFSGEILPLLADLYGIELTDLLQAEGYQHINLSKNNDHAVNAFWVQQDSQKPTEVIVVASLESTIQSQKQTIETQQQLIEFLRFQLELYKEEIRVLKGTQS